MPSIAYALSKKIVKKTLFMKPMHDIRIFVVTVRLGSMSQAARQLHLTPAAISAALQRLEKEVGTPLLVRSTRNLRLTSNGAVFHERCQQALALIEEGVHLIQDRERKLEGTLMISLPEDLGRNRLLPWLDTFMERHTALNLRLLFSDARTDLHRENVDAVIRYGELENSSLIAMPLVKSNPRVLCAAPDYLSRHGTPDHLEALHEHDCIPYMVGERVHDRWRLYENDKPREVRITGRRIANDGEVARHWALAGRGIIYRSRLDTAEDLASGRLIRVMPHLKGENAPLHFLVPQRRMQSPAIVELRRYLSECLTQWLNEAGFS